MSHKEIKDLISLYSLDVLDKEERETVESHLHEGCAECQALLTEMRSVTAALAYSAESQTPPPELKEEIFERIDREAASFVPTEKEHKAGRLEAQLEWLKKSRQKWLSVSWALGFALVVIATGLSWYAFHVQSVNQRQQQQIQLSDLLIRELRTELANKEQILKVLQAPRVRMVDLNGQAPAPNAGGKVVWDPDRNEAVVYVHDLPPTATDRDYQLWMLRGNQPVDAGLVPVDVQGRSEPFTIETISDATNLSAFAITMEPKGGVPQPTGQIYLLGATTP